MGTNDRGGTLLDLTEKLAAKFKRAGKLSPVEGVVERSDELLDKNSRFFIVTIRLTSGGKGSETFWIQDRPEDPNFFMPGIADRIGGQVGAGAVVDFAGKKYRPFFDYRHLSADSERAAFEWFARHPNGLDPS